MKKLLLILALALSANAWAEFKIIDCFSYIVAGPNKGDLARGANRITFDPELPDAEREELKENGECDPDPIFGACTKPVKVTVFPSYYRFVWAQHTRSGKTISVDTLDLSRKDLTFTRSTDWTNMSSMNSKREGKCELVEIDTSDNIL